MRVLMTLDGVGGVFTYALDLIRGLRRHGVEVSVAVLGPALARDQEEALRAAGPTRCHAGRFRLEWMEDPWEDLERARRWLLELERIESPDLIHAGSYFCGSAGFQAPVVVVAHSCVYSWWEAVHGCEPPESWHRYRETVREGLRGAQAVVAPTRAMLEALGRHYGFPCSDGQVINNGSSVPISAPRVKQPWVLAAGRAWDAAKNLSVLDEVAGDLEWPVLIAGEGQAREDPVPAGARWLGRLPAPELATLRRRATVFVSPALYEPFGLGILEAARDGCALVLGDIPSLRELWADAAMLVAPRDRRAIGAALRRLLKNPGQAVSQGRKAQRHAERYSVTAMADAYAALYRRLVTRTDPGLVAA